MRLLQIQRKIARASAAAAPQLARSPFVSAGFVCSSSFLIIISASLFSLSPRKLPSANGDSCSELLKTANIISSVLFFEFPPVPLFQTQRRTQLPLLHRKIIFVREFDFLFALFLSSLSSSLIPLSFIFANFHFPFAAPSRTVEAIYVTKRHSRFTPRGADADANARAPAAAAIYLRFGGILNANSANVNTFK